jgi:hypothetical protein
MAEFKAHMLERFIGTAEGEVTEYLGCEVASCYVYGPQRASLQVRLP